MRIAYVCTDPGIDVFGTKGASIHVQAVLRVLVAAGCRVELVCARTDADAPAELSGVPVHRLPRVRGAETARRESSARATDTAVAEVLDRLHRAGPLDLVYERYALWGRTATAWSRRHGVRSVLEVNAPLVDEQARHRHLVGRDEAEAVARAAIGTATTTVCVTEEVAAWARARAEHPGRVHVVANGVDTRLVRPTTRRVAPASGPFTIGFVGTLKAWHGVETLLEATAALVRQDPSHRLLLVGSGPRAESLTRLTRDLGIADHVETTGAVPAAAVPRLLRRMDVAVAPYPPQEGFYFSPLKVYEYLAAGLPVVASAIGVLPDLLEQGRLGELVEPGSADGLAAAIAALRADVRRRERLRHDAVRAASAHDWTHVVDRILTAAGVEPPGGHHAA